MPIFARLTQIATLMSTVQKLFVKQYRELVRKNRQIAHLNTIRQSVVAKEEHILMTVVPEDLDIT